jgi:hypothetical protein
MVYCPQDGKAEQLYVVKRQNVEEYETGSNSYVGPKLYKIGNAKSVANKNNKWRTYSSEEEIDKYIETAYGEGTYFHKFFMEKGGVPALEAQKVQAKEIMLKELAKGPWVVAPAVVSCGLPIDS